MNRKPVRRRVRAAVVLCLIFVRELLLSACAVARAALGRTVVLHPAIIEVPVDLRTEFGVAAVANLISLTPGTTTLHVNPAGTVLYVHCLHIDSQEETIRGIKTNFEYWVRELEG